MAADRRRSRAVRRGEDPFRVHTVFDDADLATIGLAGLLEDRVDHRSWRADRACVGMPVAMFFPERGDHETLTAAQKVCAACPVRVDCFEAHLHERDGVYGGASAKERRKIRRARLRAAQETAA